MSDYMELGDSGLIPVGEGLWKHSYSGNLIDEDGRVFTPSGDLVFDPSEDDCRD